MPFSAKSRNTAGTSTVETSMSKASAAAGLLGFDLGAVVMGDCSPRGSEMLSSAHAPRFGRTGPLMPADIVDDLVRCNIFFASHNHAELSRAVKRDRASAGSISSLFRRHWWSHDRPCRRAAYPA